MENIFSIFFIIINIITRSISQHNVGARTEYSCDRHYVAQIDGGVVVSDNYPFNYHDDIHCRYTIYTKLSHQDEDVNICFTFYRFQTESIDGECSDYLVLNGTQYCGAGVGPGGTNIWMENLCTNTFRNKFKFDFHSDHVEMQPGFYATYIIVRGSTFPDDGSGESPNDEPCADGTWRCFNRRCIQRSLKCDGHNSCGDNSDESYSHARCTLGDEMGGLACDFTSGNCESFVDASSGWEVVSRSKHHEEGYGPLYDHTYLGSVGHSYYVATNFEHGAQNRLVFEVTVDANTDYCLSFWYHMSGFGAGKLHLYHTGSSSVALVWSRDGNYSDQWHLGEFGFNTTNTEKQNFFFLADRGSVKISQLALDDIYLHKGACLGMTDASCNFESGNNCGWDLGNDWKTGDSIFQDSKGNLAYLSSISGSMRSPYLSKSRPQVFCLIFWKYVDCSFGTCEFKIHLDGMDFGVIELFTEKFEGEQVPWTQNKLDVKIYLDGAFQIVIEGTRDEDAAIAVDTIELVSTECRLIDLGTCGVNQFKCRSDKRCIPESQTCDGYNDCIDGSDESEAAGCPECQSDEFTCYNGYCVDEDSVCNGIYDCRDESDEFNCGGDDMGGGTISISVGAISGITVAILMIVCLIGFRIGWCILKGDFQQLGGLWSCCRNQEETEDPVDLDEPARAPPPTYSECVAADQGASQPNSSDSSSSGIYSEIADLPPSYDIVRSEHYLEITHPVKSEMDKLRQFSSMYLHSGASTELPNFSSDEEDSAIVCDETDVAFPGDASAFLEDASTGPSYQNFGFVPENNTVNAEGSTSAIFVPWKARKRRVSLNSDEYSGHGENSAENNIGDAEQISTVVIDIDLNDATSTHSESSFVSDTTV